MNTQDSAPDRIVDTSLLYEMMSCPNCSGYGEQIREVDNATCTWLCTACGWSADGRDFDPGLDDRIDALPELWLADISAVAETALFASWDTEETTKYSGTVDGKIVTAYCDTVDLAHFQAALWAENQGYDITLQQWARFDSSVFIIPDQNLANLTARIDKMNRKAHQLDVPAIDLAILGTIIEHRPLCDADRISGYTHVIHCTVLRITGNAIKLDGGWTFIGTLEHNPAGNVLRAVPDETIPDRFRLVEPNCDHCQMNRKRTDTYIVKNEPGAYLQVGRTCLKNYLGHRDPNLVAAYLENLSELGFYLEDEDFFHLSSVIATGYDGDYFLGMVAATIRLFGWTPKSKSDDYHQATVDITRGWIEDSILAQEPNNRLPDLKYGGFQQTSGGKIIETNDADFALGRAVQKWARELTEEQLTNDYMWNLFVVAANDGFTWRQLGLAASMVPAYTRTLAKTLDRLDQSPSNWQGTIKKRQQWSNLLCTDIKHWESDWGVTYFHKFTDPAGNVFIWKTGSHELEQGETYHGKATVKAHDTYNETKQTVLTRADFYVLCCDKQKRVKKTLVDFDGWVWQCESCQELL